MMVYIHEKIYMYGYNMNTNILTLIINHFVLVLGHISKKIINKKKQIESIKMNN